MAVDNKANVAVGKPLIGGAFFTAASGTTVPTAADSTLVSAFVNAGYISEDGFTDTIERETSEIKEWGGNTVAEPQTSFKNTFKVTFIESLNTEVLKIVYGDENVSGTLAAGITALVNSKEFDEKIAVVDMKVNSTTIQRCVYPCAKVVEIGDVTYKSDEAIAYEVTFTAFPDASGNTQYKYLKTISSGSGSGSGSGE